MGQASRLRPATAGLAEAQGAEAASLSGLGVPSPALARLFTPRHAPEGAFEVRVIDVGIIRARQQAWQLARPDGAGEPPPIRELDPLDVFGDAGDYPHTTVARLYTGRKAKVVRIPVERDGRTVAALTLVSPYPDPSLKQLREGTLVIVLNLGG